MQGENVSRRADRRMKTQEKRKNGEKPQSFCLFYI